MRRRSLGSVIAGVRARRRIMARPQIEAMEDRQLLTTFFVTNTNDNGPGSLREAMIQANTQSGFDVIDFNIDGSGVHVITLTTTPLPTLTDTVLVDGTTQPVNGGPTITTPLIQLDGSQLPVGANDGIRLNAVVGTTPSTIRGLAISGFTGSGIYITGAGGNSVQQNLIGTNAAGTGASANGTGITIDGSSSNTVGGTTSSFRNIISGNTGDGVLITGAAASSNVVQGNSIGIDVNGVAAIANTTGVRIVGAGSNVIGGATSASRNVISGNTAFGVIVTGTGSSSTTVQANYIGVNSTGNGAVPNGVGLQLEAGATNSSIGGTATNNRNVIAGNLTANMVITSSTNNLIVGNTFGLNADGTAAINVSQATVAGLEIEDGSTGNTIGGVASTSGNVFGGAAGPNIQIRGKTNATVTGVVAGNNLIQGNYVGTILTGLTAASTTTGGGGIVLTDGTTGNTIGGASNGFARNVIAGNIGNGISILGTGTSSNVVQGNNIGVKPDSITALANSAVGVFTDVATNNTIGGSISGAGNIIANNGAAGVYVNSGNGITISRNSITGNTGLGIDLAPTGVNENVATNPGDGPNRSQNFPVLTAVTTSGTTTTVTGTLHSAPNTVYVLEFFSNTTSDSTNHGQGQTFVGSTSVTTNAQGDIAFSAVMTSAVAINSFVSATATDGQGDTSEFSANLVNAAPTVDLGITIIAAPEPVAATGALKYTITVTNAGPSTATNVVVTNTLPTGVSFIGATSSQGTITQSGTTVTSALGSLATGATATFTISVVAPSTAGSITDTATVTSTESDPNSGNNSTSVTSTVQAGPDIVVTTTVTPSTVGVGQTSTITYYVTNASTSVTANSVVLTAPLSANATVISSSGTQGTTSVANGTLTSTIGSLAPGVTATVSIVVSPTATGTILTTATVTSNLPDVNPATNTATSTLVVTSTNVPTGNGGPRILALNRAGFHGQRVTLSLTFDSTLDATSATNLSNYILVSAGRDGVFGTNDDQRIRLSSASYNNATHVVQLRTRKPFSLHQPVQLTAVGSLSTGIRGTSGLLLDGEDNGDSGSNFINQFSGVGPGRLIIQPDTVDAAIASLGNVSAKRKRR